MQPPADSTKPTMVPSTVFLCRTLLVCVLLLWCGGPDRCDGLPYYPRMNAAGLFGNFYNSPEAYRLSRVETEVNNYQRHVTSRLQHVEQVLAALARQQCQTNEVTIEICPSFDEAPIETLLVCVIAPIAGAPALSVTRDVLFTPAFLHPPVVTMGLSGQALVNGKNCSVRVTSVTPEAFTFTFVADDVLPVQIQLVWFACPSALLSPQQSLTSFVLHERGFHASGTGSGAKVGLVSQQRYVTRRP